MQTQGSGGDADIESRAVHTVGQGEGGANRESSMETSIAVCGMARGDSLCDTGSSKQCSVTT